jgi:GAF domain/ANTAR domain
VNASSTIRSMVEAEPSVTSDPPSVAGWIQRMCRVAMRDLHASGVGVSVVSERGGLMAAASSGATSALVEDLQFSLGEGPCLDAHASQQPVLVPDLTAGTALATWPGYAPAAHQHGVRAVFAFPLQVGTARLGSLDVYRDRPGALTPRAFSRARDYADIALATILDAQADPGNEGDSLARSLSESGGNRLEIYQAQGMVMVQLGISIDDAMARIRAHAFADNRRLIDVANDLIARRLVLESDRP